MSPSPNCQWRVSWVQGVRIHFWEADSFFSLCIPLSWSRWQTPYSCPLGDRVSTKPRLSEKDGWGKTEGFSSNWGELAPRKGLWPWRGAAVVSSFLCQWSNDQKNPGVWLREVRLPVWPKVPLWRWVRKGTTRPEMLGFSMVIQNTLIS